MKKIIVSVTNDLVTDQRVFRTAGWLLENDFSVTLIGRKLQKNYPLNKHENLKIKRFHLLFNKGPLFYMCYNLRLFCYLFFRKKDFLLANDLDTLLANFWASKFSKATLVYDAHELFTEVPELIHREKTQKKWLSIEKRILPKLKNAYTVCQPIADHYKEKYNTEFKVVRNLPYFLPELKSNNKLQELANGKKIILYQGALNIGRGLEQMIDAVNLIQDKIVFVIIGNGDITNELKQQVNDLKLENTVYFLGRIPYEKLSEYTSQANLGISMEQPGFGLSYEYALPNKLFDYIQSEVPVLTSNLSGVRSIVDKYKIGIVVSDFSPENLSSVITEVLNDEKNYQQWKTNLKEVKKELCWDNEKQVLSSIFLK